MRAAWQRAPPSRYGTASLEHYRPVEVQDNTNAQAGAAPPVIIAGCGRSGTTYLKVVLDASPEVFIPTESLFIADYLRFGPALPSGLRRILFWQEPQLRAWYDLAPDVPLDDIPHAIDVIHRRMAEREGARVWGQKTPRFVRRLPVFRRAFPGCRFILIHRDPRAVVASMLRSPRHTYSLVRACRRWVFDNSFVVRERQNARPDVMIVSYEDFVRRFDAHLPRLFRFAGVEPLSREEVERRARVREYRGTRFRVSANTVRRGVAPDPALIDAWKTVLTAAQVREIERLCSPLMEELGYTPLSDDALAALPRRRFETLRRTVEPFMDVRVVWAYLRFWPYYPIHHVVRRSLMHLFARLHPDRVVHGGDADA